MIAIKDASQTERCTGTIIKINGGTVGFTTDPVRLVKVLKLLKWTACLAPTASVSFNTFDREIRIYLDEGRPLRPVWHLEEGGIWPPAARYMMENPEFVPSWRNLVLWRVANHRKTGTF